MPDPYAALELNLDALSRVRRAGQMTEADSALIRFAFNCNLLGYDREDGHHLAVLMAVTETLVRRYRLKLDKTPQGDLK
jgi:hypothetical protein